MKLTKKEVEFFEEDQKQHGTKIAMFNLIWIIAVDMLNDIGVKNIKTN